MNIQHWIILVVGFLFGYAFLAVLYSSTSLADQFMRAGKAEYHNLLWARYVAYLAVAGFLIVVFFGVASYWIDMLAGAGGGDRRSYVKLWFRGWFVGMLSSMLLPILEAGINKRRKRK